MTLLFSNLKIVRACLYSRNCSGVALLYKEWRLMNDILRVQYLTHVEIALAGVDKSFCFKFDFRDAK